MNVPEFIEIQDKIKATSNHCWGSNSMGFSYLLENNHNVDQITNFKLLLFTEKKPLT